MKYLLLTVAIFSYISTYAVTGNPSSLKLKVYRFAVSPNEDCSSPQVVIDNGSSPDYISVLGSSPDLGSGALASGNYPCVIIEMSDWIKFTPDGNVGAQCVGGTEYTLDVCGNGDSISALNAAGDGYDSSTCPNDNGADPTGTFTETKVTLFLSTLATTSGGPGNTFEPPSVADTTNGISLANQLVVTSSTAGIFVVDGSNQVDGDAAAYCEFQPPAFSFDY